MRMKIAVMAGVMLLMGYIGWSAYVYSFDTTQPTVQIIGFEQGGSYCGDAQCSILSDKKGDITIWLDGQPLVNQYRLSAAYTHPFVIPTKTMANGKHTLKAYFTDTTYHKNNVTLERDFKVDNLPLQAALVRADSEYKVFQGRTLHVQVQTNKKVKEAKVHALSREYICFPESKNSLVYETFIPIECEETPNEYPMSVEVCDEVGCSVRLDNKFQIVSYPFKKQILNISAERIEQEQEAGSPIVAFEQRVEELTAQSPQEKLWRGTFCTPVDILRVTTDFGTVRTTQHKGRYAHKALDVTNQPRSVIWAPQDGIVVMKDRFAHSGNTIIIDHGWGILSMFFHLDSYANIKVGDKIAQGSPLGTIGQTGYAKGYHLHWEMRVSNVAIDPMQWTKDIF